MKNFYNLIIKEIEKMDDIDLKSIEYKENQEVKCVYNSGRAGIILSGTTEKNDSSLTLYIDNYSHTFYFNNDHALYAYIKDGYLESKMKYLLTLKKNSFNKNIPNFKKTDSKIILNKILKKISSFNYLKDKSLKKVNKKEITFIYLDKKFNERLEMKINLKEDCFFPTIDFYDKCDEYSHQIFFTCNEELTDFVYKKLETKLINIVLENSDLGCEDGI